MRILFLAFDIGEFFTRWASAVANEAEVCLMLSHDQAEPNRQYLSPRVNFQPFHKPRLRQPLHQLRMVATLVKRIKQFNPDVIQFQTGHLWFNLALPLLRQYPLVISVHDPRDHSGDKDSRKTPQWLKDFGYRRAQRLIVHSESMRPVVSQALHIPENRIDVIPLIAFGDGAAQPDVAEVPNQVLFFGRIWHYKGLEYLIRAEPLITAAVPDARIVIAGRGDDFAPYRQMMRNPDRFIVYNEYVSAEKQATLLRQASVVALPYIEATQSGVIPLAYNFAKPVVATTVGGLVEQVDDGHTGYLVPPQDEHALAEKVIHLLQNPTLRQQMGRNAKHKLDTEWSAHAAALKTIQVYQRVIIARQIANPGTLRSEVFP